MRWRCGTSSDRRSSHEAEEPLGLGAIGALGVRRLAVQHSSSVRGVGATNSETAAEAGCRSVTAALVLPVMWAAARR